MSEKEEILDKLHDAFCDMDAHSYNGYIDASEYSIRFTVAQLKWLYYALGKRDDVKHGHWYRNKEKHGNTCFYCSACERMALADCMIWELTDYCPNCGATMDEVSE